MYVFFLANRLDVVMSIYHFDALNHTEAQTPLFNMRMQLLNERTKGVCHAIRSQ